MTYALVSDQFPSKIRKVMLATGVVTTVAGGGHGDGDGMRAQFVYPLGVALSRDNSFALVADTNNCLIRKINMATNEVSTGNVVCIKCLLANMVLLFSGRQKHAP